MCTEDPKRSIGLWHGVMAATYNGLHVVFVPPSIMTTMPVAWLHMIQKHRGTDYSISYTFSLIFFLISFMCDQLVSCSRWLYCTSWT